MSAEVAAATVNRIEDAGGEAFAVTGDVTDPDHVADVVAQALERWGRIDVLVNNAVWFNQKGSSQCLSRSTAVRSTSSWVGPSCLLEAVGQVMIDQQIAGSIINVLSTAAWQGQPGNIGYSTGKSGLINFTRSVAMELAEYGIRVNGFTPTATQPEDRSWWRGWPR
ncbi:hypothetical protein GCM10020255_008350 [Rhodococcus baikonurensis]